MDGVNTDHAEERVIDQEDRGLGWREHRIVSAAPVILLLAGAALAPAAFEVGGYRAYVAVAFAAGTAWLFLWRRLPELPAGALLAVAVAARAMYFPMPPRLSGDVYRYLWDGLVSAAGINPYAYAPADPSLAFLRRPWHALINYPGIASIYPPWAQLLFFVCGALGGRLVVWRLMLAVFDVLTILLLRRVAGPSVALAWALFPPLLLEGFWSAHIEVVAASLGLAALVLLRRRGGSAGLLLGIATGVKVTPAAVFPALLVHSSRKSRFAAAFVAAAGVPVMIWMAAGRTMPGFAAYATRWVFNSPAYEAALFTVRRTTVTRSLRGLWTQVKDPLGLEPVSNAVYAHLYDDFVVRSLLALAMAVLLAVVVRKSATAASAASNSVGVLLLVAPAVHPWYWLVAVPFALVEGKDVWLAFAVFSAGSYVVYDGVGRTGGIALSFAPPLIWWIWRRLGHSALSARVMSR